MGLYPRSNSKHVLNMLMGVIISELEKFLIKVRRVIFCILLMLFAEQWLLRKEEPGEG